jgi:hypothetical protein
VPIRARVLAPVIEEADVVVLVLERLDLARDEGVELLEIGGEIGRNVEVHGVLRLRASRDSARSNHRAQGARGANLIALGR